MRAEDGGAREARRVETRSGRGGKGSPAAPRDARIVDALTLAALAIATLLFAQRPSFGGAVREENQPQKIGSVASVTQMGAVPRPSD